MYYIKTIVNNYAQYNISDIVQDKYILSKTLRVHETNNKMLWMTG